MPDCYVIMYSFYDVDYSMDSVAAVCSSLPSAIKWLEDERKDKPWSKYTTLEGDGITTRIVTEFTRDRWSSHYIRKHVLLED